MLLLIMFKNIEKINLKITQKYFNIMNLNNLSFKLKCCENIILKDNFLKLSADDFVVL